MFNHRSDQVMGLMYVGAGREGLGKVDPYRTWELLAFPKHEDFSNGKFIFYDFWHQHFSGPIIMTNLCLINLRPQDYLMGQSYLT